MNSSTSHRTARRRPTLLLSIDFEDWHQLVRRRVGAAQWQRPGPALARQTDALLALLDELGVRATFFVLGMAARAHPHLLEQVAAGGHEIACHGDAHEAVYRQTSSEFVADLRASRATIERLTGATPVGYRAPAFSITRDCAWAFDVLALEGFRYDASQHDSPRIRDRVRPSTPQPHQIASTPQPHQIASTPQPPHQIPSLWEFPVAVWRPRGARVPVGGAAYWSVLPESLILRGLAAAGPMPGIYLHPYELDPQPLAPMLGTGARASQRLHGAFRATQRNLARRRAADILRAIAGRFELTSYGEAYARLTSQATR